MTTTHSLGVLDQMRPKRDEFVRGSGHAVKFDTENGSSPSLRFFWCKLARGMVPGGSGGSGRGGLTFFLETRGCYFFVPCSAVVIGEVFHAEANMFADKTRAVRVQ